MQRAGHRNVQYVVGRDGGKIYAKNIFQTSKFKILKIFIRQKYQNLELNKHTVTQLYRHSTILPQVKS